MTNKTEGIVLVAVIAAIMLVAGTLSLAPMNLYATTESAAPEEEAAAPEEEAAAPEEEAAAPEEEAAAPEEEAAAPEEEAAAPEEEVTELSGLKDRVGIQNPRLGPFPSVSNGTASHLCPRVDLIKNDDGTTLEDVQFEWNPDEQRCQPPDPSNTIGPQGDYTVQNAECPNQMQWDRTTRQCA
jgi:pyruvate/2-oxoglutarate dehydrogenase complex dihydrolipoamide acyltransferase (E2) component